MATTTTTQIPKDPASWKAALDALPSTPEKIPSFYFAHGSPILQWPDSVSPPGGPMNAMYQYGGPKGPLAKFLKDFGKTLLTKYKPKGILVFSAHWETGKERLGE